MTKYFLHTLLICTALLSCNHQANEKSTQASAIQSETYKQKYLPFDSSFNTIHIFVALCDNQYQGIVLVPEKIGNGQDANNNLYWGCGFGIRTYFKNSEEWKLVRVDKPIGNILERLTFKHTTKNYYLVADAYDGQYIKQCTEEFLSSCAGQRKDTLQVDQTAIGIAGNSKLIAYIGHDGLMDFQLQEEYQNVDSIKRDVIILACYSQRFFAPHLQQANINPLVWTTGLMCPEAYTIHDAISGFLNNENNEQIRTRAALAYSKYQKCSVKAARNLLVTGW